MKSQTFAFVIIMVLSCFAKNTWATPCDATGHNSFDPFFRTPFGAVKTDQKSVQLRFRTCQANTDQVRLRVWDAVVRKETWVPMVLESSDIWSVSLDIPSSPTILYYFFEARKGNNLSYYIARDGRWHGGGWGRVSSEWNDMSSYQITVYDKDFKVPQWLQGSIIYHALPDRFRNGDPSNDPQDGTGFVFEKKIRKLHWSEPLCDPRGTLCPRESDNQFYGGDLQGITDKLDELQALGVNVLYMNPIFLSATNHRYDTQDYFIIDPKLGGRPAFDRLVFEAKKRGIRILLDGVFNHGSADSPYFDLFERWNSNGACHFVDSPFRNWFYFPHLAFAPIDHDRPEITYSCSALGESKTTYEAWMNYYEHPVFDKKNPAVRDFFFQKDKTSVAPYWLSAGAAGWRLDVAGDVAPGMGVDPTNDFWQGFRTAVKTEDPEAVLIGEAWDNATALLLGRELDSVTNYRFRNAILGWLSDGCTGLGCTENVFRDNDNNEWSSSGLIVPLLDDEFMDRLEFIRENYPPASWQAMMNVLGSHDTQRILFLLKKLSWDDAQMAKRKLKLATLFQFTYPGAPVIFYGDEVGLAPDGRWYNDTWLDDPYTRAAYPWADAGLPADIELRDHFSKLGQLRASVPALRSGDFRSILVDNNNRLLAFTREKNQERVIVVLNRGSSVRHVTLDLPADLKIPDKTGAEDMLNGGTLTVKNASLDCGDISPLWGKILLFRFADKTTSIK
jgi:glycosidase